MYLESRRGATQGGCRDPETRGSDRLFAHPGPADTAFTEVGEIGDDIDLKDGKYGGEQGVARAT
jgi:hypothetical protein